MPQWSAFEEDKELVREKLQEGFIDHLEVVSRVVETEFFQDFIGSGALGKLAESYPSPRVKHDVPLWIYLASQLTLRLHGAAGYSSLPYILHCGGLRDALESGQVEHKEDPHSGERHLQFKGYNEKNDYDRATPCDQDFVRKIARDTEPQQLEAWYGQAVARHLATIDAYDKEGIFIVDGSYLFVPDNERYEDSEVGFFDAHNKPISKDDEATLTPAQRRRCKFRRYYKMAALCHTSREQDFLLYAGAELLRSRKHEIHALVPLVEQFVAAVGPGVMKTLLLDRGFIDGKSIGKIKALGVDVVIPLKEKMSMTEEAWRLAELDPEPWHTWTPPPKAPPAHPPERPEHIRRREEKRQKTVAEKKRKAGIEPPVTLQRLESKAIDQLKLWDECPVPLDVVLIREHMSNGEVNLWGLMTTRSVSDPFEIRDLYGIRTGCEEGWRQTKCFWDLAGFRSCSFALVTSQIIFVLLAFSLLQAFLLKSNRGDLASMTRQRLLAELLPDGEQIAVYWKGWVGYFGVKEYTAILLNLAEGARRRLQGTVRRLTRAQIEPPASPRRPK
jgi:hypothetical protein